MPLARFSPNRRFGRRSAFVLAPWLRPGFSAHQVGFMDSRFHGHRLQSDLRFLQWGSLRLDHRHLFRLLAPLEQASRSANCGSRLRGRVLLRDSLLRGRLLCNRLLCHAFFAAGLVAGVTAWRFLDFTGAAPRVSLRLPLNALRLGLRVLYSVWISRQALAVIQQKKSVSQFI